jgi:hypothetical protein
LYVFTHGFAGEAVSRRESLFFVAIFFSVGFAAGFSGVFARGFVAGFSVGLLARTFC